MRATLPQAKGSNKSLGHRGCNVVILIVPITTTPPLENTRALLTIPMITVWTATPQPGTRVLLEQ
jgi:hypothetical protein